MCKIDIKLRSLLGVDKDSTFESHVFHLGWFYLPYDESVDYALKLTSQWK